MGTVRGCKRVHFYPLALKKKELNLKICKLKIFFFLHAGRNPLTKFLAVPMKVIFK